MTRYLSRPHYSFNYTHYVYLGCVILGRTTSFHFVTSAKLVRCLMHVKSFVVRNFWSFAYNFCDPGDMLDDMR